MGRFLDRLTEIVVAVLCASIFATGIAQVFFRYVIQASLAWSEELSRYLFIWLVFFASALAVRKKAHIVIDIAVENLSSRSKSKVKLLASFCVTIFLLFLVFEGLKLCRLAWNQSSPGLGISMGLVYASIPLGSFLMLINTLHFLFRKE